MSKTATIISNPIPIRNSNNYTPNLKEQEKVKPYLKSKAKENYFKVEKRFKGFAGTILGVSALGIFLGSLRYGLTFPAIALKVVGDFFGSISTVVSPYFLIKNEIVNYKTKKSVNGKRGELLKIKKEFDSLREGFYRCSSLGFTPFIFEPFINPEKAGKTIFHKIATIANIPNLIFTGYLWGIGNFKALLAWGLQRREQLIANKVKNKNDFKTLNECNERIDAYNELYQSFKRMAVIGSITNPTMQGLRQFADSLALFTRQISAGEFFERPFLGFSRLVSFFVGLPEFYAKGVDSFVRLAKEHENLKIGLPKIFSKPLDVLGKIYKNNIACEKNTFLKSMSYYAEVMFHTLSPLSMFALFTPLLDEPHLNEEAQTSGGKIATFDKIVGRTGKGLNIVFNGLYVLFGRLPQTIFQSIYFGRKAYGFLKREDKKVTKEAVEKLRESFCKSKIVSSLSDIAENKIKKLVPDFYKESAENEQGYLTYEQIQANYALEQAKNSEEFKKLNNVSEEYHASTNKEEKTKLKILIDNLVNEILNKYCIPFIREDALRSYYKLSQNEEDKILKLVIRKINQKIGFEKESKREAIKFPGAEFLAIYVFKLLDLRTRFQKIDYRSSHHNMTTAYDNDEIRISFEYELLPVLTKCIQGFRNTVNRVFGMAA